MSEKFTCPICGEPTSMYYGTPREDRLCRKHKDELKAGLIKQCPDCSAWITTGETCKCKKATKQEANNELTCLICGTPSNGKHFCLDCYHKYKDRAIDIRITKCKDVEILDQYGNQKFKCKDGRKVRSKSEKIISDFLFDHTIRTIYEKTVYYYPNDETVIELHPDFYLTDYDFYIEHNGLSHYKYKENKAKTEEMYKSLGYKIIITTEEDLGDIDAKLKPALKIN